MVIIIIKSSCLKLDIGNNNKIGKIVSELQRGLLTVLFPFLVLLQYLPYCQAAVSRRHGEGVVSPVSGGGTGGGCPLFKDGLHTTHASTMKR